MTAHLSPEDLRARGFRAKAALDEFLGPAMVPIRAEYLAELTALAANEPWSHAKITKLAVAQRVIDKVEQHIRVAVAQGEQAAHQLNRAREIAALPEARRRWL